MFRGGVSHGVLCCCGLAGMAPRDMWDSNPIYTDSFWQSYVAFVQRELHHTHVQEQDESEVDVVEVAMPELEPVELGWEVYEDPPELELPPEGTMERVAMEELMDFLESL